MGVDTKMVVCLLRCMSLLVADIVAKGGRGLFARRMSQKDRQTREFSKPIISENCRPDDRSLVRAWGASLRNGGARSAICRAPVRR
jgi:hypothetical protein